MKDENSDTEVKSKVKVDVDSKENVKPENGMLYRPRAWGQTLTLFSQ